MLLSKKKEIPPKLQRFSSDIAYRYFVKQNIKIVLLIINCSLQLEAVFYTRSYISEPGAIFYTKSLYFSLDSCTVD